MPRTSALLVTLTESTHLFQIRFPLLRVGTLPEVWIPPAKLRDLRGLLRTRRAMRRQASLVKNCIRAAIRRYGLRQDAYQDLFSGKARVQLSVYIASLPAQTRFATTQ